MQDNFGTPHRARGESGLLKKRGTLYAEGVHFAPKGVGILRRRCSILRRRRSNFTPKAFEFYAEGVRILRRRRSIPKPRVAQRTLGEAATDATLPRRG